MKKSLAVPAFLLLLSLLSSCSAIGDIFQAGMGFGIFLVILVVAIIVFVVMRGSKK